MSQVWEVTYHGSFRYDDRWKPRRRVRRSIAIALGLIWWAATR